MLLLIQKQFPLIITLQDVWDFLTYYWVLVVFIGGIIWSLIKMKFDIKNIKSGSITAIHVKLDAQKKQLDAHDLMDKETEQKLTRMIDRNKQATEDTAKELRRGVDSSVHLVQAQLQEVGKDIAVIKNNLNLIMNDKIKKPSE